MTENKFFNLCEKLEGQELPAELGDYFPTVEEIDEGLKCTTLDNLLPIIIYISGNPKKGTLTENLPEYKEAVAYAKNLLEHMKFDPEVYPDPPAKTKTAKSTKKKPKKAKKASK